MIHNNPRQLTPNQRKWMNRYLELSGDNESDFLNPPEEFHIVVEWDSGWCDYSVDANVLWIWSLYSHNDGQADGLSEGKGGDAMEMAVKIAKNEDCEYIDFDTHRQTKDWIESTKKHGKIEVISRQLRVVLK